MSSEPYDTTTLSERIRNQLSGIQELSAYFASLTTTATTTSAGAKSRPSVMPELQGMTRIHLGDEWWADLEDERVGGFLRMKQASLEQLQGHTSSFEQPEELPDMLQQLARPASLAPLASPMSRAAPIQTHRSPSEESEFLFSSNSIPLPPLIISTGSESRPAVPTVLDEIGKKLGTPLGLADLVDEREGVEGDGKVQMAGDGTVLNEEGLPFLDIRESPSSTSVSLPSVLPPSPARRSSVQERTTGPDDTNIATKSESPITGDDEEDDYWSAEKVRRRAELKTRLFGSSTVTNASDKGEGKKVGSGAGKADMKVDDARAAKSQDQVVSPGRARPKGYLAKSTVLSFPQPTPYIEDLTPSPPSHKLPPKVKLNTKSLLNPTKAASSPSSSEEDRQPPLPGQPSRRKSVTFAPEARVRTFEKGEAMPMSAQGVDFRDPKDSALRQALVDAGVPEAVLKPLASPIGSQTATGPAAPEGGVFSTFKKGFLNGGAKKAQLVTKPQPSGAYKAKMQAANGVIGIQPVPALIISGPDGDEDSSDSRIPIAAAHEPIPAPPVRRSLFAQRKAEAVALKEAASADQNSGNAKEDAPVSKASGPMKTQVMERFSSAPKPMKKAPEALPQPIKSRYGPPPKVPDIEEVLKQVREGRAQSLTTPSTDGSTGGDADVSDDTASLVDGEYSDDEEDYSAAGMDEKLLLRETVMAYHQQRASMGRQGLGGAVGQADRELGIDENEQPRYRAVGFGERVTPKGMEGGLPMPTDATGRILPRFEDIRDGTDEDGDEEDLDLPGGVLDLNSISLPTIIPGSSNLVSGIRVGKLENGNLLVQDKDDSSDESGDQGNDDRSDLTPAEREQLVRRKAEKKAENAMREKLMDPDLAGLMWREAEEANARRLATPADDGRARFTAGEGMMGGMAPAVRATPLLRAEGSSHAGNQAEALPAEPAPASEPPKKISKFKAARLAAAAAKTDQKDNAEPLRLRGGGFVGSPDVGTTPPSEAQTSIALAQKPPAPRFTVHHALMLRALDLTLNCEVSQTAFSVGSIIWYPATSRYFDILGQSLGPIIRKGGQVGIVLAESWSRALPGNTHAEQNAFTILAERFQRISHGFIRDLAGVTGDVIGQEERERAMKSVLADARIYATMEPCSVRTSGLPSCSAAILSSGIPKVYIGVDEPADYVNCEGLRILQEGGVEVHHVDGMGPECLRAARRGLVDGTIE